MANPGHPSIGLGYLFYVILRAISFIAGEDITRSRRYGEIILPATLLFMIAVLLMLLVIILYI